MKTEVNLSSGAKKRPKIKDIGIGPGKRYREGSKKLGGGEDLRRIH